MSDPLKPSERDTRETAFANETRPADSGNLSWPADPYSSDRYLVPDEDAPVIHQERLFSRRVLFGWAFAALLVVFAVTVILPMLVPIVKETVVTNVMARMKERGIRVNEHQAGPEVPEVPERPELPERPEIPEKPGVAGVPQRPAIAGEPAPPAARATETPATAPAAPTTHHKTPAPASSSRR